MTLSEFYAEIGGDLSAVLARIPSRTMLLRFVRMYTVDPSFAQLNAAVQSADWPTAFCAVHTLKGVAQNLGFARLQAAASALTEHLRGGHPCTIPQLLDDLQTAQTQLLNALSTLSD